MHALIWHGPYDMRVEEVARPQPGPGEVLVQVKAVGICGSDIHGYTGASGRRTEGMVMGHEFAGVISELGPGATGVNLGQRVAVNPLLYCGECDQCRAGREQTCRKRKTIGVNTGLNGGFAEYVVAPARNAIPLADGTTFGEGTMAEPLGVGLRAAAMSDPHPGVPMAVLGGGTIGLCTLLACKLRGAEPVFVTDVAPHKLTMIRRLGGEPLNSREIDFLAAAKEATGGEGFTRIIDAVAISATIQQALPALTPAGTLTLVGLATPQVSIGLYDMVPQERTIKSAYAYSAAEYRQAVELINSREVDVRPMLEEQVSLLDAPGMFKRMSSGGPETPQAVKVVVEV
ncbi:MAG: alcohol dehydrogenase catalytic domain-containing protein [Chloroflexota bacterium]|nr:alcohol dehydrogenase catalytic domain-containing protein [Chloroflexota bacterium]